MITDSLGPVSFGLFMLAVLGSLAAGAGFVLALMLKRQQWARVIALVEAGGLALYTGLFLITSLVSRTQELAVGVEKHICEVDCHLAYSVAGVKTVKVWGAKTAHGMFYVITVRVRFDSGTIASWRPRDVPVYPNGRSVALIDAQGRRYPAAADALDRQLLPGQEYTTDFVFDVPPDAGTPRLELQSGDWPTHFMIAHENAFLHGKVLFRVAA